MYIHYGIPQGLHKIVTIMKIFHLQIQVSGLMRVYFKINNNNKIIIIIFINCNWVVTWWQWLFCMYTKYEIGY